MHECGSGRLGRFLLHINFGCGRFAEESPQPFSEREDRMGDDDATGKVPLIQQLLDNPFLLLFIGVLLPMVVYTVWGVIDILTVPLAK